MNKALLALLWIASALLTYWVGLEQGSTALHSDDQNYQKISSLPKTDEPIAKNLNFLWISPSPVLSSSDVSSEEVATLKSNLEEERKDYRTQRSDLQERMKSSNPLIRLRAFTELLEDGSAQSIEQAREIYEKLPEGPQRFSELRMLAFTWGQSDPQSALEWSRKLEGFDQRIGTGSVLDSWARYDSAGAIAWAQENFDGEDNPYFIGIISGMSDNDLVGASELMTSSIWPYPAVEPLPSSWRRLGRWVRMWPFILQIIFLKDRFRILHLVRLPKRLPRMILVGPSSG